MAEEPKEEGSAFADALSSLWKAVNPYPRISDFVSKTLQFEPYFIAAVWGYFFFFWLPGNPEPAYYVYIFSLAIAPFVLPFLLIQLAVHGWFEYRWQLKYDEREYCVLEIRLPEEVTQTPYAAELMLRGIYQTGDVDTEVARITGSFSPWFSLEIVSTGGKVQFFIWTQRRFKQLVEAQVYAHYPTVQVVEVPDYTLAVPLDPAVVSMFGIEQSLQKPDPYPILTYVETGLDKQGVREEFKHDPLASLIEILGSIREGEHVWIQYIVRAHQKGESCPWAESGKFEGLHEPVDLADWVKLEIAKILKKTDGNYMALSEGDKHAIQAMEMKLNKQLFEVGIRAVYIARNDVYGGAARAGIPSAFRSFEHGSEGRGLNGLKPEFWIGRFNYPWQDFMNIRRHMLWRRYYDAYITRQFFFPPHKHRWIVLNTEELATMYHFPGGVVHTPTLQRMPSKRAEAPANLPT